MGSAANDRLIDAPGTAERLGVSRRTVSRLAERGVLTRIKILTSTRYKASEVEELVREGTRPLRKGGDAG